MHSDPYFSKGRLCQATTSATSVDYSYTPEGWVAARGISHTNGPIHLSGFTYNALGQLASIAYPDGNAAYYDYTRGAVSGVGLKVFGNTVNGVTNVTYRPMDAAMSKWTSYNGLINTIGYDSDLRPTAISVPGVQSLAFTWDTADRITSIANGVNGNYTQSLTYDAVDRLTSMASGARNESYQYDAVGNRIGQVIDGVATSFAYSSGSNRLVSASGGISAAYGYNAYGSTTTINGVTIYTYDPFGRLSNAGGATFDISAEDQRLRKAFGGDVTYFVPGAGGGLLAENTNGTWKDYVWLNGRLVAMVTGGSVYSVHADQTGRAMALTAPNQSVAWASRNDPFDRNTVTGSSAFFRLGFPGQYWDVEDSLWHNGFRDYDSKTGRYIQSDPIGLGGGVNTYVYVGGNPISFVDSLGLTQAQVDCMLEKVRKNNPDLNVPARVRISKAFEGMDTAITNPITKSVILSNYYNGDLDADGLVSAFKTLTHESIHRTRPRSDMMRRPFNHPDIYEEAARRTGEYLKSEAGDACECK